MLPLHAGAEGYIVLATKNGLIKKTALTEFANIRKVGKIAINLVEGDELISVALSGGDDEIIAASHEGKCIRFSEHDIREMGRASQGVRSMDLADGDSVVDMAVVKPELKVITMTENGYGKLSEIDDYRLQSRAGKGVKAGNFNDKTGKLVSLKLITGDEDIMVITTNGTIIKVAANEISTLGRATQGVRIMKTDDSKVSKIALAPHEEESESEEIDSLTENDNPDGSGATEPTSEE